MYNEENPLMSKRKQQHLLNLINEMLRFEKESYDLLNKATLALDDKDKMQDYITSLNTVNYTLGDKYFELFSICCEIYWNPALQVNYHLNDGSYRKNEVVFNQDYYFL